MSMSLKAAKGAMDFIYEMESSHVLKCGMDVWKRRDSMADQMDGVITAYIWSNPTGDGPLRLTSYAADLRRKYWDEVVMKDHRTRDLSNRERIHEMVNGSGWNQ